MLFSLNELLSEKVSITSITITPFVIRQPSYVLTMLVYLFLGVAIINYFKTLQWNCVKSTKNVKIQIQLNQ